MYLFWTLWGIDALVSLILVFFFFVGLSDGTVSSYNIYLWLVILFGMTVVMVGSYLLFTYQYSLIAKLLLSLVAIPSILYGLLMGLMILAGNSSGWK